MAAKSGNNDTENYADESSENRQRSAEELNLEILEGKKCEICGDPLIQACRIYCGHTFCRFCIDQRLQRASMSSLEESHLLKCPTCSEKITNVINCPEIDAEIDKLCSKLNSKEQLYLVRKKAMRRNQEKKLRESSQEKKHVEEKASISRPIVETVHRTASRTGSITVLEPSYPSQSILENPEEEEDTNDPESTPFVLHETITIHRTRILDPSGASGNSDAGHSSSANNFRNFNYEPSSYSASLGGTYECSYSPYNNCNFQSQYPSCSYNCAQSNSPEYEYPYFSSGIQCEECQHNVAQDFLTQQYSSEVQPNYAYASGQDPPASAENEYNIDVQYHEIPGGFEIGEEYELEEYEYVEDNNNTGHDPTPEFSYETDSNYDPHQQSSEYHCSHCCAHTNQGEEDSSEESVTSPTAPSSCWESSSEPNTFNINVNLSYQQGDFSNSESDSGESPHYQCFHSQQETNEEISAENLTFPATASYSVQATSENESQLEDANDPEFIEFLNTFESFGLYNPLESNSEFTA